MVVEARVEEMVEEMVGWEAFHMLATLAPLAASAGAGGRRLEGGGDI